MFAQVIEGGKKSGLFFSLVLHQRMSVLVSQNPVCYASGFRPSGIMVRIDVRPGAVTAP